MISERTARTRLEYWRELLEEARDELAGTRRRYVEASGRGAGQKEMSSIREDGEALAARVAEEEGRIADEEARLAAEYPEQREGSP